MAFLGCIFLSDTCGFSQTTVSELMTAACALFELDEKDVQLSDYYSKKIYGDLGKPENAKKKLEEVQITSSQHILLGEQVP